jgi:putative ABC transport system substrate-binding protein
MRRREFIALLGSAAAVLPRDAVTQPAAKVARIGVVLLSSDCPPTPLVKSLAALGWVEGRNIHFDCLSAFGRFSDLSAIAGDLVARRPDVIASGFLPAIEALKTATSTIPIVMLNVADPVRFGLIQSLSRPGGNVTGLASALGELDGKRIELLKELLPKLDRLAIIESRAITRDSTLSYFSSSLSYFSGVENMVREAGDSYHLSEEWFYIKQVEDLPSVLKEIASKSFDALYPVPGVLLDANINLFVQSASAVSLPTIGWSASQAKNGLLMSYGPNEEHNVGRGALYISKILKGAKPSDLPVEQPTEFDLVINLRTAKALGLTIPPSLLARADEVIE